MILTVTSASKIEACVLDYGLYSGIEPGYPWFSKRTAQYQACSLRLIISIRPQCCTDMTLVDLALWIFGALNIWRSGSVSIFCKHLTTLCRCAKAWFCARIRRSSFVVLLVGLLDSSGVWPRSVVHNILVVDVKMWYDVKTIFAYTYSRLIYELRFVNVLKGCAYIGVAYTGVSRTF